MFLQPNPGCCSRPRPKLPPHSIPIHPSIHLSLLLAIHGAAQGHGQSFHPIPPPSIHPSIYFSLLLAGSKVLKRPLVRRPIGHPLGVNPAGVLLFRNRALWRCFCSRIHGVAQSRGQSFHIPPYSTPIHPSIHLFAFIAGSKVLKRPLVRKPMGHPLGLNPAGVLLFRNRALGGVSAAESTVLLRATAKASTPFHPHPSIHPSLFAFSWFEGAETAPGPQTTWPPLGRESCWGSAVSEPCPRRCFRSRIHGAVQGRYIKRSTAKASTSFHPHPSISSIHIHPHPSIHPSLCF